MRRVAVLAVAWFAGCGFGESGIAPPVDRFFFPAGVTVDPGGEWLYVVNSNSDLRFNAGTVMAVDLRKAAQDRAAAASFGRCPTGRFVPGLDMPAHFCCHDFIDERVTNCDERAYAAADATVRIGSFGGTIVAQDLPAGGTQTSRLFVAVRAEPSITFIDVTAGQGNGQIALRCADPSVGGDSAGANPLCTDAWRVKLGPTLADGTTVTLQEEPHAMVFDEGLGVLYVGHLGAIERGAALVRGVSLLDVCAPRVRPPRLASVLAEALPRSNSLGITSVVPSDPGNPQAPIYATAEFTAEVTALVYRDPGKARCDAAAPVGAARDLTLVPGTRFMSSIYGTRGADLRGLVFSPDQKRAYVLHRQYANPNRGEFNPPSVVAVDRSLDSYGQPVNRPIGLVEVCNGPTELHWHDAGRGPRLYVNCFEGGQVYVVDPALMAVEAIIEVGAGPTSLAFVPRDPSLAFVAGFANNNVSVIDLRPGAATEYLVVQRIGFPRASTQ